MASITPRPLPGGPLAIDLLNTGWMSSGEHVDWLNQDPAVAEFVAGHDRAIGPDHIASTRIALIQARELVRRVLKGASKSKNLDSEVIAEINDLLMAARVVLRQAEQETTVNISGDQPHNSVAIEALINALELRTSHPNRVRSCEHEACVLWFVDTSRSGRRRWCSMERCGNRAKAKRHYQRSIESGASCQGTESN